MLYRSNLAGLHARVGRLDEAESLYRQVLDARREDPGPDHPDTANTLGQLADLALRRGRTDLAGSLAGESLRVYEKARGPGHPDTARALVRVARVHAARNEHAEALPLLQRAAKVFKDKQGERHPNYLRCLVRLAQTYEALGSRRDALNHYFWPATGLEFADQTTEAAACYRAILAIEQAGPARAASLDTLERLAGLLEKLGLRDEALRRRDEALRRRDENIRAASQGTAASDPDLLSASNLGVTLEDRARCHQQAGNFQQAKADLKEALAVSRRAGSSHRAWNELCMLESLYQQRGQISQWLECLRQRDRMKTWTDPALRHQAEPLVRLAVRCYPALHRADRLFGERLGQALDDLAWRRMWWRLAETDFPTARREAAEVLRLRGHLFGPESAEAAEVWLLVGRLSLWDDAPAAARAAFERAARLLATAGDRRRPAGSRRGPARPGRRGRLGAPAARRPPRTGGGQGGPGPSREGRAVGREPDLLRERGAWGGHLGPAVLLGRLRPRGRLALSPSPVAP